MRRSGRGCDDRRDRIRDRLQELSKVFAIDVAADSVLSNHFHVVLRNMPDRAASWSAREVVRRWAQIHPSSVLRWAEAALAAAGRVPEPVTDAQAIAIVARDDGRVAVLRDRLSDLSWFMKGGEGIGAAPSLVVRHKR